MLQMGKGVVRGGLAVQEHRRQQRCWMLCRGDVLPQLPVSPGGIQDQTQQGSGPDMALLAGYFTMFSNTSVSHDADCSRL